MKTRLMLIPMGIELIAGTYQGIEEYWPVQPSQKMPITRLGPPTIAPYRRFSGGGNPRYFCMRTGYPRESHPLRKAPIVVPIPTPMNVRPS